MLKSRFYFERKITFKSWNHVLVSNFPLSSIFHSRCPLRKEGLPIYLSHTWLIFCSWNGMVSNKQRLIRDTYLRAAVLPVYYDTTNNIVVVRGVVVPVVYKKQNSGRSFGKFALTVQKMRIRKIMLVEPRNRLCCEYYSLQQMLLLLTKSIKISQ